MNQLNLSFKRSTYKTKSLKSKKTNNWLNYKPKTRNLSKGISSKDHWFMNCTLFWSTMELQTMDTTTPTLSLFRMISGTVSTTKEWHLSTFSRYRKPLVTQTPTPTPYTTEWSTQMDLRWISMEKWTWKRHHRFRSQFSINSRSIYPPTSRKSSKNKRPKFSKSNRTKYRTSRTL